MRISADMSDVWKVGCPPKVVIFVWQLLYGGVMVRDALSKRGILASSKNYCPRCADNISLSVMYGEPGYEW